MPPSPIFEAPLLRALLRTLLFAAILEALFYRLLTIPAESARPWLEGVHASTARAGMLMFFVAFLLLLPTLITVAYAALRLPAWPPPLNGFISIGLLTISALGVSASVGPRAPSFALGFTVLGLLLSLAMLAGFFERQESPAARWFAVALGGSLTSISVAEAAGLASTLDLIPRSPVLISAALSSAWWLLFAAGGLAYFAFAPLTVNGAGGRAGRLATLGLSTVSSFGLILGAFFHPAILQRVAPALGTGAGGMLADVFKVSAAAAALFLVSLTALRGLALPHLRAASLGLIFLLLAGYPRVVVYQHLLSLLGVVLITGSAPGATRIPVAATLLRRRAGPPWTSDEPPG